MHLLCESFLIPQVGILSELPTKIFPAVYRMFLSDVLLFEYFVIFGTSLFKNLLKTDSVHAEQKSGCYPVNLAQLAVCYT